MSGARVVQKSHDAKCLFKHRGGTAMLVIVFFLIPAIGFAQEKSDAKKPATDPVTEQPQKTDAPKKSPTFYSPLRKKPKKNTAEKPESAKAVEKQDQGQPVDPEFGKDLPVELMDKAQPQENVPPPENGDENGDDNFRLFFSPTSPEAIAALNALPRAARTQLENKIVPALGAGNFPQFVSAMELLVSKQQPETVEAVDDYCRSIGIGTLKSHVTDILVRSIEQGLPIQQKGLQPAFVEYVVSGVLEAVELELLEVGDHALMQDPLTLPADWRDSEQLFWEVHVWKNRFNNLLQMVSVADKLQEPALNRATKDQDVAAIERLQKSGEMVQVVRKKYQELRERETELRIEELARAEEVLRLKPDFESQLNAAFVLEMHGGALDEFFRENPPATLQRERLREPNILTECSELLVSGREHGKDIIEKAVLLRVGAHWWLRGRYGVASMASGLLKPPSAMKSQDMMFGLFMPKQRPQAIGYVDSETGSESTGYDRRHYFTWAVERRDVEFHRSSSSGPTETYENVTGSEATHFW